MKQMVQKKGLLKIRIKFLVLYFLNLIDIIFTLVFMSTNNFIELNPFMKNIVKDSSLAIIIKAVIPAILLGFLAIRIEKANEKQLKITNYTTNIIVIIYTAINFMHIISFAIFKMQGIL